MNSSIFCRHLSLSVARSIYLPSLTSWLSLATSSMVMLVSDHSVTHR